MVCLGCCLPAAALVCKRLHTCECATDKVSGVELKEPVLSNALKQPFSTTGMLSCLMASCEQKAKELECTTGGLDTLLHTFPQYECLFLIKCASF